MTKTNFKMMGVINITPNSFSDGGKNLNPQSILRNCQRMASLGVDCYDFGAESTAPFNQKIEAAIELKRFKENLFPVLGEILKLKKSISIDTYKTEVFRELAMEIYRLDPSAALIWNDISGSVDDLSIKALKEFPNCTYVLCHNLAPTREESSDHIKYIKDELSLEEFFKRGLEKLSFHKNILLDPCFGFSKSPDQNWMIIKSIAKLYETFDNALVLGISKKSFLKSVCKKFEDTELSYLEILHLGILLNWQNELGLNPYYLRVHDVALGHFLTLGQQNLTIG